MVGDAIPLVKGTPPVAVPAPLNAGGFEVAEGSARTEVLFGFKTLYIVGQCPFKRAGEKRAKEVNLLVDDVNHAIGEEEIRGGDSGRVDEHSAIDHRDGQVLASGSLQCLVGGKSGAVSDRPVDDVVSKDTAQGLGTQAAGDVGNGGKSSVSRHEDGNVPEAGDCWEEPSLG